MFLASGLVGTIPEDTLASINFVDSLSPMLTVVEVTAIDLKSQVSGDTV